MLHDIMHYRLKNVIFHFILISKFSKTYDLTRSFQTFDCVNVTVTKMLSTEDRRRLLFIMIRIQWFRDWGVVHELCFIK